METPKKTIDAVRMVRRIRDAHHRELEGASRADRIAFFNAKVTDRNDEAKRARESTE